MLLIEQRWIEQEDNMNARFKRKWVKALRSGQYEQCRHSLHADGGFCCIGVGYKLMVPNFRTNQTRKAAKALGLTEDQQGALVDMNDWTHKSFAEIADYIEQNL